MLLVSSGWKPGMPLNILQCAGQQSITQSQISEVPEFRTPMTLNSLRADNMSLPYFATQAGCCEPGVQPGHTETGWQDAGHPSLEGKRREVWKGVPPIPSTFKRNWHMVNPKWPLKAFFLMGEGCIESCHFKSQPLWYAMSH